MERKLDFDESLYESEELSVERYLTMNLNRSVIRFGDDKSLIRLIKTNENGKIDRFLIFADYAEQIFGEKDDDIKKEILELLPSEVTSKYQPDSLRMSELVLHPANAEKDIPRQKFWVLTGIPHNT